VLKYRIKLASSAQNLTAKVIMKTSFEKRIVRKHLLIS